MGLKLITFNMQEEGPCSLRNEKVDDLPMPANLAYPLAAAPYTQLLLSQMKQRASYTTISSARA